MPNATAPAAATGLPNLDRRRMLLGLAAASTAAATATSAATPMASSENPELIRLAQELPTVESRYRAAQQHQVDTKAKWEPLWPLAVDEITLPGRPGRSGWPMERTFQDGALYRAGEIEPRQVVPSYAFRCYAARARRALKSKKLAAGPVDGRTRSEWEAELIENERCFALASNYEAETKRIREASSYKASWKAHAAASDDLAAHVALIMGQPDFTMEGLIIKAQALNVWSRVDELYRRFGRREDWYGQIAASILRHARLGG